MTAVAAVPATQLQQPAPAHQSIFNTIREADGSELRIVAFGIRGTKYPPATIPSIIAAWKAHLNELKKKGSGWIIGEDDFGVADALERQMEAAAQTANGINVAHGFDAGPSHFITKHD